MKIYIRAGWYEDIEEFLPKDSSTITDFNAINDYDFYDNSEYEDFYNQVKRRKIYVPLKVARDIPDYNAYRKSLYGTLCLSMQSGESIETLYNELCRAFPGIVERGILNQSDMLLEIVDATLYAQNILNEAYYQAQGA